jgi:hypothetical protein
LNAVVRLWWTFLTALPLQRRLAGTGIVLGGLLVIATLVLREPLFLFFGFLVFFTLVVFPALFASAAVFRALSAARANQLLPRFRARMLAAALALETTGVVLFAVLLFEISSAGDRPMPLEPLVYGFAFGTATFLMMFLLYGDWRWMWAWIGASLAFTLGLTVAPVFKAIPASAWLVAAPAAWAAFGAWYLRARRIRPLALAPRPPSGPWSRSVLDNAVPRDQALRVLVTAQPPLSRQRLLASVAGIVLPVGAVLAVPAFLTGRLMPFTSFVWPFAVMMLLWGKDTAIVHRSRLLWLRMPGSRDVVRREVEHALLRNLAGTGLLLLGAAALYASPLAAAPPRELLAGLALSIGAGLFATYVALAATPGNFVHMTAFAVLMAAQIGLLARFSPELKNVVIVTAIELIAAAVFRAFAVARWRRVDWLRLRPLSTPSAFRGA